jgi:hypothetical protein
MGPRQRSYKLHRVWRKTPDNPICTAYEYEVLSNNQAVGALGLGLENNFNKSRLHGQTC